MLNCSTKALQCTQHNMNSLQDKVSTYYFTYSIHTLNFYVVDQGSFRVLKNDVNVPTHSPPLHSAQPRSAAMAAAVACYKVGLRLL